MVFDALHLAMRAQVLEGTSCAGDFVRLCDGLPAGQDAGVVWSIRGRHDAVLERYWLDVSARGQIRLLCQRCLQDFMFDLQVSSTLELVPDQARMQAIEAHEDQAGPDDTEYLLADSRQDALELVEDELILALPYAPRHETCPQASEEQQPSTGESPFAVLAKLRKH